ncbi:MAG: phosphatase PAP2 family protein [Bacteriovoracaceae bacterium]|nr:phosphatase PAP2 family protein [Bacteriovoracaceae bacterium]
MFEYKIQKAWENYHRDFGLGRILLFISFYNTFLFFTVGLMHDSWRVAAFFPVGISLVFIYFRRKVIRKGPLYVFIYNLIPMGVSILYNYILIGLYDKSIGGITRVDPLIANFDNWLFGQPISLYIEELMYGSGIIGTIFYDLIMTSYIVYFILPFYGAVLYYRTLPPKKKYKVGRLCGSVTIYFCLNYLCYISIPVTGPQYFYSGLYTRPLPLSSYGYFIFDTVANLHNNFIDCFPSGHFGIAVLITIWLFRMNHIHRFFMAAVALLIMLATISLRYHYTLDIIAAIPLAGISYYLGKLLIPSKVHINFFRDENER